MPVNETVTVTGITPEVRANVVALHKGTDAGPYQHFQAARRCVADSQTRPFSETQLECLSKVRESTFAIEHRAMLPRRAALLAAAVSGPVDAILSPPSDFPDQAEPFRRKLSETFVSAVDLTSYLKRADDAKRAATGAGVEEVTNGLTYSGRELHDVGSLLVVDDTFKGGTTIGAVVSLLRRHGLRHDAEIILACPLWVVPRQSL